MAPRRRTGLLGPLLLGLGLRVVALPGAEEAPVLAPVDATAASSTTPAPTDAAPSSEVHSSSSGGDSSSGGSPRHGPMAKWTPAAGTHQSLSNIFWTHIPKTSTTFSRTVFSYACGVTADDFAATSTHAPPRPSPGACSARLSAEQDGIVNASIATGNSTWFHLPVPLSLIHI